MSRRISSEGLVSIALALVCHAVVIVALQLRTPARPLPIDDLETPNVTLLTQTVPSAMPPPAPVQLPTPAPTPEPVITEQGTPPPLAIVQSSRESAKPAPKLPAPSESKPARPVASAHSVTSGNAAPTSRITAVARPSYRSNPKPEYPADARRLRQEGVVVVSVEVSADGHPLSVSLKRSSGVLS